jgi:transposase InsO family protein
MNAVYKISGVTKQAFHKQAGRQIFYSEQLVDLQTQVDEIRSLHPGCGLEKLYDTLKPSWLGRDKFVSTFMRLGYRVSKKVNFTRTTTPACMRYPNLIEGLLVWDKNRVWQTDITYFEVAGSFCYIVFIIDIYTKVIRGYQASDHMRAEANLRALQMALRDGKNVVGLIHHSDRGSQYVDTQYRTYLNQCGIHISMGVIAQDNAYAERVNGIIKNEYLRYRTISTLADLRKEVKKAVDHYNEKRIHRHLPGKQSPREFELQLVHLNTRNRPKVIVYTEGNSKIRAALSRPDFYPETGPQDHVCPMVID